MIDRKKRKNLIKGKREKKVEGKKKITENRNKTKKVEQEYKG